MELWNCYEIVAATQKNCPIAKCRMWVHPKFLKSARSIQLKKDFSKWCFYGRMFLLFPQLPAVEWYCGRNELNKTACKILTIPATSAAVERLFSCNSNVHTAKRSRLSNERAAKAVFVS